MRKRDDVKKLSEKAIKKLNRLEKRIKADKSLFNEQKEKLIQRLKAMREEVEYSVKTKYSEMLKIILNGRNEKFLSINDIEVEYKQFKRESQKIKTR
ncbi:hypothetical protein H5T51_02760, partial [Candidatus Bathyarchaeota archaeon]|nr:hypothetical protein [Candidatus Bathyarchaeota archaeon]